MKEFWAYIEKRGTELKDKVVISLEQPRSNVSSPKGVMWPSHEWTTLELGEVKGLYKALTRLIDGNSQIFNGDGSLKARMVETTVVITHDEKYPIDLSLMPPGTRIVTSRTPWENKWAG